MRCSAYEGVKRIDVLAPAVGVFKFAGGLERATSASEVKRPRQRCDINAPDPVRSGAISHLTVFSSKQFPSPRPARGSPSSGWR